MTKYRGLVQVTNQQLAKMMKLPPDIEIIGAITHPDTGTHEFVIRSSSETELTPLHTEATAIPITRSYK